MKTTGRWPKWIRLWMLGLAAVLLPEFLGCLEYDEQIILNRDGSGQLSIHYQAEKDMRFHNLYFPTDIYDVDKNIQDNYLVPGVLLVSREVREKGDRTHVYMEFQFTNVENLNQAPRFQDERFVWKANPESITFKRFLYMDENRIKEVNLFGKMGIKSLFNREVLEDIRFRFQVLVPGDILSTNADLKLDRDQVLWERTLAQVLQEKAVEFSVTFRP